MCLAVAKQRQKVAMMNDSELKHIFMILLDVVKAWRPLYEEKRKRADYQMSRVVNYTLRVMVQR